MKNTIFIIILSVLTVCSCNKENNYFGPIIKWEKPLPNVMKNYGGISSPILSDGKLLVSGRNKNTVASTFFKFDPDDFSSIIRWNEETFWDLASTTKYLYKDLIIFNNRNEEIIGIDINTLETKWKYPCISSKDGFKYIDNKIYITRHSSSVDYYEIDLDDFSEKLVFSIPPTETGIFGILPKPDFYKLNHTENGIITIKKEGEIFKLINHNLQSNTEVWNRSLKDFVRNSIDLPFYIHIYEDKFIVSSLDYLEVRNLSSGQLIWSKKRLTRQQEGKPVLSKGILINPSTEYTYCYDSSSGEEIWKVKDEGKEGIRWGSGYDILITENLFFLHRNPINIHTGKIYWTVVDRWGEQPYEFKGVPAIDYNESMMFYTNRFNVFKVDMPK